MDYDGQNEHAITHLGTISLSPRISPDNSRVAFSSLGKNGWSIRMYSLLLNRAVGFKSPAARRSLQHGRAMATSSHSLPRVMATIGNLHYGCQRRRRYIA